ncbi:MAG: PHP domain-containing protein [Lactobacillaceae bacterium]|jgi:histidinol-phosphatase (PHP family)|nr:PHP domain-containing protein [Lactobacillaceae bacterium]
MQDFSYHTHTVFSDGCNTVEEMLEQAVKAGYKQIGISDHLIINEFIANKTVFNLNPKYRQHKMYLNSFGAETVSLLQNHVSNIRKSAKKYPIEVLVGFETDYFSYNGWEEKFKYLKEKLDLDYLLLASHFCVDEKNNIPLSIEYITAYTQDKELRHELVRGYFSNIAGGAESGLFDFAAHLSYIDYSDICDNNVYWNEYVKTLMAIKDAGLAIELNTAKNNITAEFMPTKKVLEAARDMGIPLLISDDCHSREKMKIGYAEAEEYLKELNYINRWKIG